MLKLIAATAILSLAPAAIAQSFTDIKAKTDSSAYAQDNRGVILRSGTGLCWRTGFWSPADAVPGCDGELVPPVASPIAPAVVTTFAPASTPSAAVAPKRCDFAVTLGGDESFEFNKAALNDAARRRIDDEVIGKLQSCGKVDVILVTGHTDRLGSRQYNQRLSEKRANAVATYIKGKGVAIEITTLGAGKTQAVKSCNNRLPHKKLITCLTSNRRVTIEVQGLLK